MPAVSTVCAQIRQTAYNVLCYYKPETQENNRLLPGQDPEDYRPSTGSVCRDEEVPFRCLRLHQLHFAVAWVFNTNFDVGNPQTKLFNPHGLMLDFNNFFGPCIRKTCDCPAPKCDKDECLPPFPEETAVHSFQYPSFMDACIHCGGVYAARKSVFRLEYSSSAAVIAALLRAFRKKSGDIDDSFPYLSEMLCLTNIGFTRTLLSIWIKNLIKSPPNRDDYALEKWKHFFDAYLPLRENMKRSMAALASGSGLNPFDDVAQTLRNTQWQYDDNPFIDIDDYIVAQEIKHIFDDSRNALRPCPANRLMLFLDWFDRAVSEPYSIRIEDIPLNLLCDIEKEMKYYGLWL